MTTNPLLQPMRDLYRAYVRLLESGKERIEFHGGTCDSVEQMERGDPYLIAANVAMQGAEIEQPHSHETLPVATPEISIDIAHSQALSAFADRYNGEGPSLPSEDRWVSGYMHALLDIGRGKATAQKALEPRDSCKVCGFDIRDHGPTELQRCNAVSESER